ncbi:Ribose import ATP-binding protein RbsA 2 [uncultured Pleomorphomonas sp.]|uniref:Ribose import ATP-binding protein RbsA 2 n=1 Tax=uncultured Pleomorphomonas sp. TaxID=442121 RepID=A0A212LFY8_9HYPH|nr:sugar ABC transporter ATP-binding protein [uncultured Pleomorphomonas sp.]SCM76471.1 Ribose import ATP-binding protein RbsA 2 [uncultured Pleomorphomonas sp.]
MPRAWPLVELINVTKEYPGVRALSDVNFELRAGEVHVLFGENGAGKSTLISILAGAAEPTSGTIRMGDEVKSFQSVRGARAAGIGAVFQEFSLVPTMTVFENIFLGEEPGRGPFVDRRRMRARAVELFDRLGFSIDVDRRVATLSRAEQQMVEIAKALHADVRILILDEPTASLTERETQKLFAFIRRAKDGGMGIVYISHRIQEFSAVADRITVLRDGRVIGTVKVGDLSEPALIEMMTGRTVGELYPTIARRTDGEVVLAVRGLTGHEVRGVDFEARRGEVLGLAGLVGSGKSAALRAVVGLMPITGGTVALKGRDITGASTRAVLRAGVFYLPSDRKSEGLVLAASARDNIALSMIDSRKVRGLFGLRSPGAVMRHTSDIGVRVDLTEAYLGRVTSKLSGGNQQKVLFGKGFGEDRDLYIFDEPTVGVDVGTRSALYRLIKEIAEAGKAVVVISSDLPEVMSLSHRLLVFSNGRIAAEFDRDQIEEQAVLGAFFKYERQTA